jgi:hypothetical protein
MNKIIAPLSLLAFSVCASGQITIATFNTWDVDNTTHTELADSTALGWVATLTTSTNGSTAVGATLNLGEPGNASAFVNFTNNTGSAFVLDTFAFTFEKQAYGGNNGSADWGDVTLFAGSGITGADDGDWLFNKNVQGGQYYNVNGSADLSAYSIAAGATGVIEMRLVWDGTTGIGVNMYGKQIRVKSLSLTGDEIISAIPEPSMLSLAGGLLAVLFIVKRRRA